jgi:hypothetical protein
MKDLVISNRRIIRELRVLLICFVIALLINAGAIVFYKTEWKELLTTLPMTAVVVLALYGLSVVFRLIVRGIAILLRRKS